jgi:hypothetical protein
MHTLHIPALCHKFLERVGLDAEQRWARLATFRGVEAKDRKEGDVVLAHNSFQAAHFLPISVHFLDQNSKQGKTGISITFEKIQT